MAELLKNAFGPDVPARIGSLLRGAYPPFDLEGFVSTALTRFEELELTERARHISAALAKTLPQDRGLAIEIIRDAAGRKVDPGELKGMDSFLYLPLVFFVAEQGLECFEVSMEAQYELTKRFTAEESWDGVQP